MKHTQHEKPTDTKRALARIIRHLLTWQKLLKARTGNRLSRNQQQGLIGELFFLKEFLAPQMLLQDAVMAWWGPAMDEQDFVWGHHLVEVKSTRGSRDNRIHISSENQLDVISAPITLVVLNMACSESGEGITLNQIVRQIRAKIPVTALSSAEHFEEVLAAANYKPDPAYSRYHFTITHRRFYKIEGDFPRICAAELRNGVDFVRYQIALKDCTRWEIDEKEAKKRILQA